jgi:hypothetical protein
MATLSLKEGTYETLGSVIVKQVVQPETPPTPPPLESEITLNLIDSQIADFDSRIAVIQAEKDALNAKRTDVLAVAETAVLAQPE